MKLFGGRGLLPLRQHFVLRRFLGMRRHFGWKYNQSMISNVRRIIWGVGYGRKLNLFVLGFELRYSLVLVLSVAFLVLLSAAAGAGVVAADFGFAGVG